MINIITALHCEAKPVIDFFRLKEFNSTNGLRVFANDDICLAVGGIGKSCTIASTAYMHGLSKGSANTAWLNMGIAGHNSHALGKGFLVNKITDAESGQNWYPVMPGGLKIPSEKLVTVTKPEGQYPHGPLYDMEASGFFSTAARFTTVELIHCFKVVSDNSSHPANTITKSMVIDLIGGQLSTIKQVIDYMRTLSAEAISAGAEPIEYRMLLDRWNFSAYQKHELKKCLRRIEMIDHIHTALSPEILALDNAGDVIKHLNTLIASFPMRISI